MCYYSLESPSRNAKEDEVLLVDQLTHARKGLVAPGDSNTAVCLTNGLRLELLYIPDTTRRRYGLKTEERATFKLRHWLRFDVLFLDNGSKIPFQELEIGQVVRILFQPADSARTATTLQEDGVRTVGEPVDAAHGDN
jgi:hypothetical protein